MLAHFVRFHIYRTATLIVIRTCSNIQGAPDILMTHPATTAAKEGSNMDGRLILARKIRRVSRFHI